MKTSPLWRCQCKQPFESQSEAEPLKEGVPADAAGGCKYHPSYGVERLADYTARVNRNTKGLDFVQFGEELLTLWKTEIDLLASLEDKKVKELNDSAKRSAEFWPVPSGCQSSYSSMTSEPMTCRPDHWL